MKRRETKTIALIFINANAKYAGMFVQNARLFTDLLVYKGHWLVIYAYSKSFKYPKLLSKISGL